MSRSRSRSRSTTLSPPEPPVPQERVDGVQRAPTVGTLIQERVEAAGCAPPVLQGPVEAAVAPPVLQGPVEAAVAPPAVVLDVVGVDGQAQLMLAVPLRPQLITVSESHLRTWLHDISRFADGAHSSVQTNRSWQSHRLDRALVHMRFTQRTGSSIGFNVNCQAHWGPPPQIGRDAVGAPAANNMEHP